MTVDSWHPCIVIPVYNHEHAIGSVVEQLLPFGLPIILVDDGSDAPCRTALRALSQQQADAVSLLRLPENRGKGGAVKAGLREAWMRGFSHALQIDADGQHDIRDVPKFLQAGRKNPKFVVAGCPIYGDDIPKLRFYGRYLTHVWIYINTLSFAIKDSMCGFRLYPVSAAVRMLDSEFIGNRMDFDSEVLVHWVWRGGRVVNMPTVVQYPLDGVSHFAMVQDNILITKMHTRLFFGMLVRLPRLLWQKISRSRAPLRGKNG